MKLFMVLLAVGLTTSDKLNRGYLPPPGAELSGGSSADLQTPLEYPKANPLFTTGNSNQHFENTDAQNPARNPKPNTIEVNNDEEFSSIDGQTDRPNDTIQTTAYPTNDYETVVPAVTEMFNNIPGTQNQISDRYPMKGTSFQIVDNYRNGYHYRKPENMLIIPVKDGIIDNYHPNAFGMYGGNPMIIKTYPTSQELNFKQNNKNKDHNENFNRPTSDLYSSDKIGLNFQNTDTTANSLTPNFNQHRLYQSTENPKNVPSNPIDRNQMQRKRPQRPVSDRTAVELNYENIITPDKYSYKFDTSNGIHIDESAITVIGVKAKGSYSYTGDDGKIYSVQYIADGNGFQPKGDHLPTPPPIPEAIQRVIEQAKRDKEAGIFHDGSYDEAKYGHMKYQGPVDRYLQSMQRNSKPKNRNRVAGQNKTYREPILSKEIKASENQNKTDNVQQVESVFERPVYLSNLSVGEIKPSKALNESKTMKYRRPFITPFIEDNRKQRYFRPGAIKNQQSANIIKNKKVQSRFMNNKASSMINQGVNSDKGLNMYKLGTVQDSGYYYVPPLKVFVEGKFQDTPKIKETPNSYDISNDNVDYKTISIPKLYYIDQQGYKDIPDSPYLKTTSYFTNTNEPVRNTQTYGGNYATTNQDLNKFSYNEEVASTPSNGVIKYNTTSMPYGSYLSTRAKYDNTKDYQEETKFPEQKKGNNAPYTKYEQDTINLSTTPMLLETDPNLGDSNQYDTSNPSKQVDTSFATKYSEKEGYFITKPVIQANFEDFPSSKYASITTGEKILSKTISNIKVDGFGRPIQGTEHLYTTPNYRYFTEAPLDQGAEIPKSTATYYNFQESFDKATTAEDGQLVPGRDDKLYVAGEEKGSTDKNNESRTDGIIGEDFSGPKQPEG